ncbi:hypothetical protein TOPH_03147 [Tolypocladium ophioglossoides CBS 100239]|uniref:BRCT domain-containing protein n=1 Tax=Tolypocladium ophioglossoides (strain CBS 100239) TaxID=1163406 RepID=A0A0L0NE53_TOLOC|nr:hypothetical protein TOPH_03147 [Tolypocladium ophioglossoides CBS 100239]
MPRQIYRNRVLAAAGPLPGELTVDNLKRWTKLRRGEFTEDFDETVTHLLCTKEQFNKRVPRVKDALTRGKRFHIVHYDWFEFSTVYEKRQPERDYSMRNYLAKQNAAKREQAQIERGKKEGEKFVNTNLYHVYIDRDFFPYQIDITRDEAATGESGQRYTLSLWESNAKPHLYWFTAKFLKRKGDSQPSYYRPSRCSGKWRREMDLFMDFFRIKTGLEWQNRVLGEKTMPASLFQYSPPPVGRRLQFEYEYCLEMNARLRGLPWPPAEASVVTEMNDETNGADPATADDDAESVTSSYGDHGDADTRSSLVDEKEAELGAPLAPSGEAGLISSPRTKTWILRALP